MSIDPNHMFDPLNGALINIMVKTIVIFGVAWMTNIVLEKLNANKCIRVMTVGSITVLALAKAFGYVG